MDDVVHALGADVEQKAFGIGEVGLPGYGGDVCWGLGAAWAVVFGVVIGCDIQSVLAAANTPSLLIP